MASTTAGAAAGEVATGAGALSTAAASCPLLSIELLPQSVLGYLDAVYFSRFWHYVYTSLLQWLVFAAVPALAPNQCFYVKRERLPDD